MSIANFICLKCYNPLTTQGERKRHINVNQIVCIEELTEFTQNNNRVEKVEFRITLTTGEILDVRESNNKLHNIIENGN